MMVVHYTRGCVADLLDLARLGGMVGLMGTRERGGRHGWCLCVGIGLNDGWMCGCVFRDAMLEGCEFCWDF